MYMSCSTVRLLYSFVYTNIKQKICIPYQSNRKKLLETGTGPWFTPTGYLQTGISKPEPKRNFRLLPSVVKHRVPMRGSSPTEQPPWGKEGNSPLCHPDIHKSAAKHGTTSTSQKRASGSLSKLVQLASPLSGALLTASTPWVSTGAVSLINVQGGSNMTGTDFFF